MPYGAVIVKYNSLYHAQIYVKGRIWYFGYGGDGCDYEDMRKEIKQKVNVELPNPDKLEFWSRMGDDICVLDCSKSKRRFINRLEYFKGWKPEC